MEKDDKSDKDKSSRGQMIKYYNLRRYEGYEDKSLEELIRIHAKIEAGVIDKSKLKMRNLKKSKTAKMDEDPSIDTRKVGDTGVRRFVTEAMNRIQVQAILEKKQDDMSYFRQVYAISDLSKKEVCYIFGINQSTLTYYLTKYKIRKIPAEARMRITSADSLEKLLRKPRFDLQDINDSETDEEFRDRYKRLTFRAFGRLQNIIAYGEEEKDEAKELQTALSALGSAMKLELEAKKLLTTEKDVTLELKRQELEKGQEKTPVVINFGGDIQAQQLFLKMKDILEARGIDDDEMSDMLLEIKSAEEAEVV